MHLVMPDMSDSTSTAVRTSFRIKVLRRNTHTKRFKVQKKGKHGNT